MAEPERRAESASSNILPFTGKPKRTRSRRSMGAAGMLTLQLMARDGERAPLNVRRFDRLDELDEFELPERSPELLLALFVWDQLPAAKRERVKSVIRCLAYGENACASAVRLDNLLSLDRRS